MTRGLIGIGKYAGRLYDQVNSHLGPWNLSWVSLGENLDTTAIHDKIAVARFNLARITAIVGVVFQEVGISFSIGQIIDSRNLNLSGITAFVGPQY
jgi:hypothetical protein